MFDFGFSELVVIAVVALIVVGPERLPKVARTAGHLLGRLQRYASDVKSDIQREMQLDDLKKLQQQVEQQARELESSVRGQAAHIETEVSQAVADVKAEVAADRGNAVPVVEAVPASVHAAVPAAAHDALAEGAQVERAQVERAPAEGAQLPLGLDRASVPGRPEEKA